MQQWQSEEHPEKPTSCYTYKSQLQYEFIADTKAVQVKCLDMIYDYDYEYQGSANREVISPVAEGVFVNLVMAFKEHYGSIISGPMVSISNLFFQFLSELNPTAVKINFYADKSPLF